MANGLNPYHYTGIVQELAEGLRCVLQASDWKEGSVTPEIAETSDRTRAELQNLRAASTRIRNAFQAVQQRIQDIETDVLLEERPRMTTEAHAERQDHAAKHLVEGFAVEPPKQ